MYTKIIRFQSFFYLNSEIWSSDSRKYSSNGSYYLPVNKRNYYSTFKGMFLTTRFLIGKFCSSNWFWSRWCFQVEKTELLHSSNLLAILLTNLEVLWNMISRFLPHAELKYFYFLFYLQSKIIYTFQSQEALRKYKPHRYHENLFVKHL